MKCSLCEYEDISNISLYDFVVQKCSKCDTIRISANEYDRLLYNVMYSYNIGKLKSYTYTYEFSKDTIVSLRKFIGMVDLSSFKIDKLEDGTCNVCHEKMTRLKNKYFKFFKIHYCISCNSIYFDKKDFKEFVDCVAKISKPFKLIEFLKEIFHFHKVKDNVKK